MTPDTQQRERFEELMSPAPVKSRPRPVRRAPNGKLEHKQVVTEPTSEVTGKFTARISDYGVDRTGERFAPSAFDNALRKLREDGRPIPVLFGHDTDSISAVLGHVMPGDIKARQDGLYAAGWIDTSSDVGLKLYEMLKRGVLQWSIGFTMKRSHKEGEVRVLDEVDELHELSVVPIAANSRTATLDAKAHEPEVPSHTELERRLAKEGIILPTTRTEARDAIIAALGAEATLAASFDKAFTPRDLSELSLAELRARSDKATKGLEPIQIKSFPC